MGYCISKFLLQIFSVYCTGHLGFFHPFDTIPGIGIGCIKLMQENVLYLEMLVSSICDS